MLTLLDRLSQLLCTTRIMGSSTLTLAHPAAGRTLGAVIGEFHPEDHLAAALLCSEAGLAVLDEDGRRDLFPTSGGMLAARRGVAEELFGLWRDAVRAA
jgi:myo-inositol-1(or 4)-monophosphatase/deoxyribonuclease-2